MSKPAPATIEKPFDAFVPGQTKAHRLFREDPYSRLLLLCALQREKYAESLDYNRQNRSPWVVPHSDPDDPTLPKIALAFEYLQRLGANLGLGRRGDDYLSWPQPARAEAVEALQSLLDERSERAGAPRIDAAAFDEAMADSIRGIVKALESRYERHYHHIHGGAAAPEPLVLPDAFSPTVAEIQRALADAGVRTRTSALSDEETDRLLAEGKQTLFDWCGVEQEQLDALASDPDLCLALCRACWDGPTELDLSAPMLRGNESLRDALAEALSIRHLCSNDFKFDLAPFSDPFPPGTAFEPVANYRYSTHLGYAAFTRIIPLLQALGASPERSALAREALIAGTSGADSGVDPWAKLGPAGDLPTSAARKQPAQKKKPKKAPAQAFAPEGRDAEDDIYESRSAYASLRYDDPETARLPGAGPRGDNLRTTLTQLSSIAGWRSPGALKNPSNWNKAFAGLWSDGLGARSAAAILVEATAHESGIREALAEALVQSRNAPAAKTEIAIALARRVAEGFSALPPSPSAEVLFPGLADALEALAEEGSAEMDPEASARWSAAELRAAEDPMGSVAIKASKSLGRIPGNPDAVVGEAKKALFEEAGLSNAAWKALCQNPALRGLFESALSKSGELSRKGDARKRGKTATRKAEDVMREADAQGEAFAAKLRMAARKEHKSVPALAAGRALSAGSMASHSPEAQARLLELIADVPKVASLLAGIVPVAPESRNCHQRRQEVPRDISEGPAAEFRKWADGFADDVKALSELAPAFAVSFSKIVEKTRSADADGPDSPSARAAAAAAAVAIVSDIVDLAGSLPIGFWRGLDPKDPLAHARRQHGRWVEDLRARRVAEDPRLAVSWTPELPSLSIGRVSFVELSRGIDLHDEGEAMHHCVASYSEACRSGTSRIFSVRLDGLRHATLELSGFTKNGNRLGDFDAASVTARERCGEWQIVQNRGKHNCQIVNEEVLSACEAFACSYSKAFAANTAELRVAMEAERAAKAAAKASAPKP